MAESPTNSDLTQEAEDQEGNVREVNGINPSHSTLSEDETIEEIKDDPDKATLLKDAEGDNEEMSLVTECKHSKGETEAKDKLEAVPYEESENSSPISEMSDNSGSSSKKVIIYEIPPVKSRLMYTREKLLRLSLVPASRQWPECFDVAFRKKEGKFDFESWMISKRENKQQNGLNSVVVNASSSASTGVNNTPATFDRVIDQERKRNKDPRERVKHQDEQVHIVLSPQRKSFSTGCHVQQQNSSLNIGGGSDSSMDRTRELPVSRRIGSGRIPRREDSDQINQGENRRDRESSDRDLESRNRDHNKCWRNKTDGRFDRDDRHVDRRRRFFDDDDKRNDRRDPRDNRDNRRYHDHRRPSNSKESEEETPEWFTGGPSSQNEFIELVGFDEPVKDDKLNNSKPKRERRRSRKEKDGGSGKNSRCTTPIIIEKEEPAENETTSMEDPSKNENPIVIEPAKNDQDAIQFNVEDYLGSILNFGSDDMFQSCNGASRLKQFFKNRESPVDEPKSDSGHHTRYSPGKENFPQLGNLLGFAEPVIRVPSPNPGLDSTRFFAPISPADKTSGENIVEMLQSNSKVIQQPPVVHGSGRLPPPSIKDLLKGGKGQSLEEIEANLRKGQQPSMPNMGTSPNMNVPLSHGYKQSMHGGQRNQQNMGSQNPFNDFLSQVSGSQRRVIAEKTQESDNILAKLLKDGGPHSMASMGNKPALPNNAPTESELIARLMKTGTSNMNVGNMGAISSMNHQMSRPPPNLANLNIPSHHNFPSNPSSSLQQQHSPSRSHTMPPPQQQQSQQFSHGNNSDLFIKLMQNQQLQQQKKQMLHPGYQQQQPQQHQHDPIKQLLGGMSNMGLKSSQICQDSLSRDIQSLLQRIANGQLTDSQLIAQLNSGNLSPQHREAIATALKLINCQPPTNTLIPPRANLTPSPTPQSMMGGGLTIGSAATTISPRGASPNPDGANMLSPHMIQQTRVSPLMFGATGAPRRTPSHQELVVHTQNILQKALLKQGMEKAKEKLRKQEAERTRSPNPAAVSMQNGPSAAHNSSTLSRANQYSAAFSNIFQSETPNDLFKLSMRNATTPPEIDGSPSKGLKCQSPLAFTPTSVMRKMTAEKDRMDKDKLESYNLMDAEKSRESHLNRMSTHSQNPAIHHPGMGVKADKRIHKVPSPLPSGASMLGPRAQMVMSGAQTNTMMNVGPHGLGHTQRHMSLQPNMSMGRSGQHNVNIRAMHHAQAQAQQQLMRNQVPHMNNLSHPSLHSRLPNTQNNPMQHLAVGNNNNYKQCDSLQIHRPIGSQSNSPVNNFMKFFGRDVMGKAGSMPELPGGKVLSVEEVERLHQSQAVPN